PYPRCPMPQSKFLIVSNARAGSTWVETMLGVLPDVAVDYEFKWRPKYTPAPVHVVIPDATFRCGDALARIAPDYPVVGSKLVLDPREHTPEEYAELRGTIGPDVRVVHLSRSLTEVYYSWSRGVYHVLDKDRCEHWTHGRPPCEMLGAIDSNCGAMTSYPNAGGQRVNPDDCERDVKVLLAHEQWMAEFARTHPNFVRVDYAEVPELFPAVARFVGSRATVEQIADAVSRPPTLKILAPRFEDYFTNADELLAICQKYEARRVERNAARAA
ncbi:MAG TPA: hypothetical protein VMZ71_04830, partial [Gemmataceae bacterium]|nr:hypothetical protein [Gemmataceae bacterium]